jgi:hypothetical protein
MTNDTSSAPRYSWRPRHVSLLTIVLALITIVSFFVIASKDSQYGGWREYAVSNSVSYGGITPPSIPTAAPMPMGAPAYDGGESGYGSARAMDASGANVPMAQGMVGGMGGGVSADMAYAPDYYPYPYPSGNVAATDTRELLKVNYNASMQTRDVAGLTRRVETTVRGHEGRIDQISASPKSGYVSFVVPMSKYDAFRGELEAMVKSKFLTVNIQSSNMLPQKQGLEEQQKQADKTLAEYQASRLKVVDTHASTVKSLQSQIDADNVRLAELRAQAPTYDLQNQIQGLVDEVASLKSQLAYENTSYKSRLESVDSSIKYAKEWQTAVKTQDQELLDNVATVNGSVSIEWISLWDMVHTYLPGYWIPAIFALLTLVSFLWDRRRFGTV